MNDLTWLDLEALKIVLAKANNQYTRTTVSEDRAAIRRVGDIVAELELSLNKAADARQKHHLLVPPK